MYPVRDSNPQDPESKSGAYTNSTNRVSNKMAFQDSNLNHLSQSQICLPITPKTIIQYMRRNGKTGSRCYRTHIFGLDRRCDRTPIFYPIELHSYWVSPGLEPWTPPSQRGILPVKLKTPYRTPYGTRTRVSREKVECPRPARRTEHQISLRSRIRTYDPLLPKQVNNQPLSPQI